jgi:hypothetical protein
VMCRSEAFCATTWRRMSEKSKFMAVGCIGRRRAALKPGRPVSGVGTGAG